MPDLSSDGHVRAVRVRVSGDVQGVFFRASTRDQAQRHGVRGWVRNDPEGTVTAVLEASPGAVEAVLAWMRGGGPPRARVDDVVVEDVAAEGHDGFRVRP